MRMLSLAFSVFCASLWLFSPAPSSADPFFSARFDDDIDAAVAAYWADYPDPLALKAQLYQESRLKTDATSPVGAAGICQVMPATFKDWEKRNRWVGADPYVARYCIIGAAQMMADLRRFFRAASFPDRQRLALGGYNAGPGNIRKAQRLCGDALDWATVATCLPKVTGRFSAETITYVDRIAKWRAMLGRAL